MEVHHHSHHGHHGEHNKKWKEYFLEFFMLFLAVSLGFLAENIREHYVEKERSHELVESFMKDVETNIKFTDSILSRNQKMIFKNDSAVYYVLTNNRISLDTFFLLLPSTGYRYINNNDTYDQMKSSGSLRYIKDTVLLRKIINYNNASKAAEFRSLTQEFEYTAHEYTEAINKWIPPEIAIRRQASSMLNNTYLKSVVAAEKQQDLVQKLNTMKEDNAHWIEGEALNNLKNSLIPVISRKTWLMSASQLYIHVAAEQAKDLLDYYHKNIIQKD